METVEVKLRPVGNALGLILPSKLVKKEKLKNGEIVKLNIIKERKLRIEDLMGIAKGAGPFERDRDDHEF